MPRRNLRGTMPLRIPLAPGKTTPSFVESTLAQFGSNPYGEPNFRLVWSQRPQNYLAGEIIPTYDYLGEPRWILERWLHPEVFAGPKEAWGTLQEALQGEYPAQGVYFITDPQLPQDWEPNEHHVAAMVQALLQTQELDAVTRRNARVEAIKTSERVATRENAQQIEELFDSAAQGKIQQAASGPKNTFRTAEDYERDRDRAMWEIAFQKLPRRGGIYQPGVN